MRYTPHTDEDVAQALATIGADSVADLFAEIPDELLDPDIELPEGLDEVALLQRIRQLASRTETSSTMLGGGLAKHFIPSVTPHLALQSEFVTSYTPYQPEVSQGILQATFEYQTMMSELTGLPYSNSSMYDGATAVAEAALLAVRHTGRDSVCVSAGVHPETREVLETYLHPLGVQLRTVPLSGLRTPTAAVAGEYGAVIVQHPNFLGYLEEMPTLADTTHEHGSLFISVVDPLTLAVLRPPAAYGADVAVGDGQTLGNPLNFGGPHFGFMVVSEPLLRQLPGRIVGETTDTDGRRAFVLTLQAREQHIRRARAKSNICSNHQLTALMAAVNLAALGPQGLAEAATGSVAAAHDLAHELTRGGFTVRQEARFFSEFVVELPVPAVEARGGLADRGIRAGIPVPKEYGLGEALLVGATELTTAAERRKFVDALRAVAGVPGRARVAR